VRSTITHVTHVVTHVTNNVIGKTSRDVSNRARGFGSEVKAIFKREASSDEVLVERVRTKVGRVVSHPHAIEVTATQGRMTLRGLILAREVDQLLECINDVRGVTGVENQLEAHEQAGNIPSLQGGMLRTETSEFMQTSWSPAARLLAGIAGGALALYGLRRRGMTRAALEVLGGSLFTRAMTNLELKDRGSSIS